MGFNTYSEQSLEEMAAETEQTTKVETVVTDAEPTIAPAIEAEPITDESQILE